MKNMTERKAGVLRAFRSVPIVGTSHPMFARTGKYKAKNEAKIATYVFGEEMAMKEDIETI